MSQYAKSKDGMVHLVSAINHEFTLCGDAFDGHARDRSDAVGWEVCGCQPITCPKCAMQIRRCFGATIAGKNMKGKQ